MRMPQKPSLTARWIWPSVPGEQLPEIALAHRRPRTPPHGGRPVDAMNLPASGSEQISEQHITLQMRSRHHNRHVRISKNLPPDLHRPADAAELRRAVECRAHFVL